MIFTPRILCGRLWIVEFTFVFDIHHFNVVFDIFSELSIIIMGYVWKSYKKHRTRVWISYRNRVLGKFHSRKKKSCRTSISTNKTVSGVEPARVVSKIRLRLHFFSPAQTTRQHSVRSTNALQTRRVFCNLQHTRTYTNVGVFFSYSVSLVVFQITDYINHTLRV